MMLPELPTLTRIQRQALMRRLRFFLPDVEIARFFGVSRQRVGAFLGPVRRSPAAQARIEAKRAVIQAGLDQGKSLVQITREQGWSYGSTLRFRALHCKPKD